MKDELKDIKDRMSKLSTGELLRIVNIDFAAYRKEAIEIVKEELKKRNDVDQITEHEAAAQSTSSEMDKLNVHDLYNEESLREVKKQIKLLVSGSSFFLWPIALIMIIATKFIHNNLLFIATVIILCLMIHRVLKLAQLVKIMYRFYYFDGPYPPQRRNALIIHYVFNIPLLILCIYLFISGKYFWIIIPLIIISFLLFVIIGGLHASSREDL
ncbi:MAG: hypothetical protein FJ150_09545 [Euryarchaeota archaeon]|nr:hypothetical protein [Euryarchaeota archaeon]